MATAHAVNGNSYEHKVKEISSGRKPFSQLSSSELNSLQTFSLKNGAKGVNKTDIMEKYSRAATQHSKRTMKSLNIISLSREHSFQQSKLDGETKLNTKGSFCELENLDGETLGEETGCFLRDGSAVVSKRPGNMIDSDRKERTILIPEKRVPMVNRLPSFSFSYSFGPSGSCCNEDSREEGDSDENDAHNKETAAINKEKMSMFVSGLKKAKNVYYMNKKRNSLSVGTERVSKPYKGSFYSNKNVQLQRHTALSISVAESLLKLTENK